MRVLHTSDWHVGKAIRGRSRAGEHQAVLAEIAGIADAESADLVVVAGDLFDTATPTAESERIVYRALLDLAAGGRPVVVIAGNHDSAQRLAAVAPLSEASGIHVAATIRPPDDGGLLELEVDGTAARLALLPFISQRYVVTADLLMGASDPAMAHQSYADRVTKIVGALTAAFDAASVNLVVAHLMVMGGTMGGGERGAHTVFDYWVPATAFPPSAQYAALGHLHRPQRLDGPAPLHYCGSPLQLDFGETANEPQVNLVDLRPGVPADVRAVPLEQGCRLKTLKGTLAQLADQAGTTGDDHLRLVLDERTRAGLADEARELFPTAVEVVLATREEDSDAADKDTVSRAERLNRTPNELFRRYLDDHDVADPRLAALFDEIVEETFTEPAQPESAP